MSQTERIDKIIEAVRARLQAEIEGVLATDFSLESTANKITAKSQVFDDLKGKQICTRLEIAGDLSGTGYFLLGIKDAIRLAGTLIMLPSSELDEAIGREEFSEEIEDAFGEIGNIIASAFSSDFEEMYPSPCIFMCRDQDIIIPQEIDSAASQPVENQVYYQAVFTMALDGRPMGRLVVLLPAETFQLEANSDIKAALTVDNAQPQKEAVAIPVADNAGDVKLSSTKQRQLVDRILEESRERLESELCALIGIDVMLVDLENRIQDKERFFSETVQSRQVLADLEVTGEIQDTSYFAISTRDAIFLGGTLIMLPPRELNAALDEGELGEDSKDAYAEIVNIIAGVYNAVFEEHHAYKLRFVKKELREVDPGQVDSSSEEPISARPYYISSMSVVAEGKPLGQVHMLIPAEVLRLQGESSSSESKTAEQGGEFQTEPLQRPDKTTDTGTEPAGKRSVSVARSSDISPETEVVRERVDEILKQCQDAIAEEVSALLGIDIIFSELENLLVSKQDFFSEQTVEEKVVVNFTITGDREGEGYLSLDVSDAIRFGGVLIMLPEAELEAAVAKKNFSADIIDAYGEIANIISAAYSTVFSTHHNKKFRFVKEGLELVDPEKIILDDNKPMPNQHYYQSTMVINFDGKPLGRLNVLFPLNLLELGGLVAIEPDMQALQDKDLGFTGESKNCQDSDPAALDILLVSDNGVEAEKIMLALREAGYVVQTISTKENLQKYLSGRLKAVYLVVKEVDERAFGMAIQVSSSSSLPVIAAGPGWTRSKVIKAVKYGVHDILLTPASKEDIQENITNNLLKLAA